MSGYNVAPLENLVEQFERMPGIGNKTAQRLAYYVLNLSKTEAEQLAGAVMDAHTKIHYCSKCCNLTDKDLCPVCANPARDHSVICVVETPRDATAIENTHEFKGVYHVLHGSISPLNDIGPDNLTIKELLARLNEESVTGVINELMRKGADVIFEDVHVSGHACKEDIKLIYSLVNPLYAIPVHGEYKHLIAQAKIAEELGYDSDHIKILSSGDVLEIDENGAEVTGHVPVGNVMVDGLGVGDVGNIVLRDRQRLAEDGIIIVVMTLENGTGQVLAGPDIVSRGFVYVRNSESLMDEAKTVLDKTMDYCMDHNITDWGKIKNEVKDALGDFVWKETKRRPMIMPIIMEV